MMNNRVSVTEVIVRLGPLNRCSDTRAVSATKTMSLLITDILAVVPDEYSVDVILIVCYAN